LASDFDDSLIEVDAKNFARWANEGKKPRCDLAVAAADIEALGTWTKAGLTQKGFRGRPCGIRQHLEPIRPLLAALDDIAWSASRLFIPFRHLRLPV
jgi:hypothetical protein